jgi:hypothetical protein
MSSTKRANCGTREAYIVFEAADELHAARETPLVALAHPIGCLEALHWLSGRTPLGAWIHLTGCLCAPHWLRGRTHLLAWAYPIGRLDAPH